MLYVALGALIAGLILGWPALSVAGGVAAIGSATVAWLIMVNAGEIGFSTRPPPTECWAFVFVTERAGVTRLHRLVTVGSIGLGVALVVIALIAG